MASACVRAVSVPTGCNCPEQALKQRASAFAACWYVGLVCPRTCFVTTGLSGLLTLAAVASYTEPCSGFPCFPLPPGSSPPEKQPAPAAP